MEAMMARSSWVVFAAVKDGVTIERVLTHIGAPFQKRGTGRIEARCPLHGGDNPRHFRATPNGRGFKCFGCGAGGNVLDLVAALEHCSTREAALRISEWFRLTTRKPNRVSALTPLGNTKRSKAPRKGAHKNR